MTPASPEQPGGWFSRLPLLEKLERAAFAISMVCVGLAAFFDQRNFALGTAVGGMVALINFRYMQHFCRKLIHSQGPPKKMALQMAVKGAFPLFAICIALGVLKVHPLGFLLGLSSYVIAIMAYAAFLTLQALFFPDRSE